MQAQPNAFCVDLLARVKESKNLNKFLLVFGIFSKSTVIYINLNEGEIIFIDDLDASLSRL